MLAPLLSELDTEASTEGPIDPLGLAVIADELANRLIPNQRLQPISVRFLTAMAVGAEVCRDLYNHTGERTVAADGVSPPWLVFEWHVIEGLARSDGRVDALMEPEQLRGVPGIGKTRQAIAEQVPLSASRYLVSPGVMGFHGVLKSLAKELDIVDLNDEPVAPGAGGQRLLEAWVADAGDALAGFINNGDGEGRGIRNRWRDAVRDAMQRGWVQRRAGWAGWADIGQYLAPGPVMGDQERKVLLELLRGSPGGRFRRDVFDFICSPQWRACLGYEGPSGGFERQVHRTMRIGAEGPFAVLLDAIMAYEQWARLLQDAFEACLYRMTKRGGKVKPSQFADLDEVRSAANQVETLYMKVADQLAAVEPAVASRFADPFESLATRGDATDWHHRLLEHHRQVQQRKLPEGKNPWFDTFDDGDVAVRATYRRPEPVEPGRGYVHGYRTQALAWFAQDLGVMADGTQTS